MRARNNTLTTTRTTQLIILSLSLYNIACDAFSTPPCRTTPPPPPPTTPFHQKQTQQALEHNHHNARSVVSQSAVSRSSTNTNHDDGQTDVLHRRPFVTSVLTSLLGVGVGGCSCVSPERAFAEDGGEEKEDDGVQVILTGEVKKLFNEGRAREAQGNIAAATRIFAKVTKIVPKFIYGWSSLGNTQVALQDLEGADQSYTTAINLCKESLKQPEQFGVPRCNDYYLLLLNRGSLRLNNSQPQQALQDLELSATLRGKPDALILQNRARAREINGLYGPADADYSVAISMTANEVTPVWLRAAMVKFQLGDFLGAFDLARRVETKYPDAPEVMAAMAALLAAKGDQVGAARKLALIPERQRLKYVDDPKFVKEVVAWPPKMIDSLDKLSQSIKGSNVSSSATI